MMISKTLKQSASELLKRLISRLEYSIKHTDKKEMLEVYDEYRGLNLDAAAPSLLERYEELVDECNDILLS